MTPFFTAQDTKKKEEEEEQTAAHLKSSF